MTDTLSADELKAARAAGMTPAEYAVYKSPRPDQAALDVLAAAKGGPATADDMAAARSTA